MYIDFLYEFLTKKVQWQIYGGRESKRSGFLPQITRLGCDVLYFICGYTLIRLYTNLVISIISTCMSVNLNVYYSYCLFRYLYFTFYFYLHILQYNIKGASPEKIKKTATAKKGSTFDWFLDQLKKFIYENYSSLFNFNCTIV
jgi:hypothetical protein